MRVLGIVALFVLAGAAQAETILPTYPVEKWCDQVSRSVGARSEMIYGGCIDQEQNSYNELKASWTTLSNHTQTWCDQVAKATGSGSYMILKGCVEQETQAAKENSTRKFQR
jgi:hypothetical protein